LKFSNFYFLRDTLTATFNYWSWTNLQDDVYSMHCYCPASHAAAQFQETQANSLSCLCISHFLQWVKVPMQHSILCLWCKMYIGPLCQYVGSPLWHSILV